MIKKVCIFGFGVAIGAGITYAYFRKKQYEFEKKMDSRIEKEVMDLKETHNKLIEKMKQVELKEVKEEVKTENEKKKDKIVGTSSIIKKVGNKTVKVDYHNVKPPLSSLMRENPDDPLPNVEDLDPNIVMAANENMIITRTRTEESNYEIIDYNDPVPMGWDSDCLKYYMQNDVLTNDMDEIFDNADYILGPEVYDLVTSNEGVVYFMNRKMQMFFEVEAINERYDIEPDVDDIVIEPKQRAVIEQNDKYDNYVRKTKMKKNDDN